MLGGEDADSTEVGRIVPIYEAIGGISSRSMRRIVYLALEKFSGELPDPLMAITTSPGSAKFFNCSTKTDS